MDTMNLLQPAENVKALPMCYYGHPSLRKKSVPVAAVDEEIQALAQRMIKTMEAHDGIGLAAPQVGVNIRVIAISIPAPVEASSFPTPGERALQPLMPLILVNPVLTAPSTQRCFYTEGCLSIPGTAADVERPEFVQLAAKTLDGGTVNYRCGGLLSRCLQHELDHLDGVLYIDYLDDETRAEMDDELVALTARSNQSALA
jgi:peptide deformylase